MCEQAGSRQSIRIVPLLSILLASLLVATSGMAAQPPATATDSAADSAPETDTPPEPVTGATPLSPQPAAAELSSGLAVTYFFDKFYTLSEVAENEDDIPPVVGEPLAVLDHVTEDGKVLSADQRIMVGALIRGMINFPAAGTYGFRVNSNDGVSVTVGGELLWLDPEVHYHRMSPPLQLVVDQPGWYDFSVDYFQKKGGSALQVLWTPPGDSESVVPAQAFAHRK